MHRGYYSSSRGLNFFFNQFILFSVQITWKRREVLAMTKYVNIVPSAHVATLALRQAAHKSSRRRSIRLNVQHHNSTGEEKSANIKGQGTT